MIDLHMHTTCSDGDYSPVELLRKVENCGLEIISITDHMNCYAYDHIEMNRGLFSGKILCGFEAQSQFDNVHIEVLCYNVDYKKINQWVNKKYSDEVIYNQKKKELAIALTACEKLGLKVDKENFISFDDRLYSSQIIMKEVCKYDENKNIFSEEAWNNASNFYRKYQSDPSSVWYFGERDIFPKLNELIELIKESKGLLFLAHLFVYKNIDDYKIFLDELFKTHKLDGIECFHSTFTREQSHFLVDYCKEHSLYMCGGSDYHGPNVKPDIELGVGRQNLNINKEIIEPWLDKVTLI